MEKQIRTIMICVFLVGIFVGVCISCALYIATAEAEEYRPLYVTASVLNARAEQTKKAMVEARFDKGDALAPTGRISRDRKWIEIYAGEAGTAWVYYEYVTERVAPYTVINENNGKIKIRKLPGEGRVTGYVKRGKSIEIDQVIFNYGHCRQGCVDLDYLIEEDD